MGTDYPIKGPIANLEYQKIRKVIIAWNDRSWF